MATDIADRVSEEADSAGNGTVSAWQPRLVDAHVHHWDPANLVWYPHLAADFDLSRLGLSRSAEPMKRKYLQAEYLRDARPCRLDKYVHVNATGGPRAYLGENDWLTALNAASGYPTALIGKVDLDQDAPTVMADLERQARSDLFRGIRIMQVPDPSAALYRHVLRFLEENSYVYDLVVHPSVMQDAAEVMALFPELRVVVEHTGWPLAADLHNRTIWSNGMRRLADLGPRVACKLSGLVMTLGSLDMAALRSWVWEAVGIFGAERCMIASNFPVDGVHGTFRDLMTAYLDILSPLGAASIQRIFAQTAERVYSI
jgi:predicted TIM-barrel fold metal-dependent hydrolase